MLSRLELLIDLLHSAPDAALATVSSTLDGYPFASVVPFATDANHRPVFLISGLAEHTRNLTANPRASLMLAHAMGGGEMARVSIMGEVAPMDTDELFVRRYLRYHRHAERFLQLGDFRFYRLEPLRALTIGGFAKAGWLEGSRLLEAPSISLGDEATLLRQIDGECDALSARCVIRGIDAFGADISMDGSPVRLRFEAGAVPQDAWLPTFRRTLSKKLAEKQVAAG